MDDAIQQGHVLRSRLLDKFAQIECWAMSCLIAGKTPCLTAPLGQKLDALAKLCAKSPPVFKSAKKVPERLDKLKPYQELRASIMHAQLETVTDVRGAAYFCFRNVAQTEVPDCHRPVLLTAPEFEDVIRTVGRIGNELKQLTAAQPSKPPPNPSRPNPPSPRPPKPGAAGGP